MNRRHFLKLGAALPLLPCVITTAEAERYAPAEITGGTFTLHYLGQTFGPFDYDATPEEIGRVMEGWRI
jgi:hypothetical protein